MRKKQVTFPTLLSLVVVSLQIPSLILEQRFFEILHMLTRLGNVGLLENNKSAAIDEYGLWYERFYVSFTLVLDTDIIKIRLF